MDIPSFTDILLVENDPREAELTRSAVLRTKLTDKVHWVKDGEEALHFIFGQDKYLGRNIARLPRIIILDLNIPKVGSIEVLKIIKGNPITNKIVVITFSGSEESEVISDAIKAGVNICLFKSRDFEQFAEMLNQELGYFWRLFKN
ncbi:MAG TPA: response regulator [Bacteroidia bacterium]|nr:response regulator [Bacteroidia bacterium]